MNGGRAMTGPGTRDHVVDGARSERRRGLSAGIAVALAVHIPLGVANLAAMFATGSSGIEAATAHLVVGVAADAAALVGVRMAVRPPDPRHPYGYARYESVASMVIGMLLLATVAVILWTALPRLVQPVAVRHAVVGLAVTAAAVLANAGLTMFLRRRARQLASAALSAAAVHAWTDAVAALAVFGGVVASALGAPRVDAVVALGIATLIGWRAWRVVTGAADVLTDAAGIDLERVRREALAVPGVRECHAVRARGEAGAVRADLHIHVDPGITVAAGHDIARAVEARIRERVGEVTDVLVHVGPAGGPADASVRDRGRTEADHGVP
jgi:cation diffusion facilitator family transporter